MKKALLLKPMLLLCALIVGMSSVCGQSITITKTMSQIVSANNYTVSSGNDATCYTSFKLDENITISTSGSANCGSFWTNNNNNIEWRLYQNKGGNITITAGNNCTLSSVTITYNSQNNGTLKDGSNNIASGTSQSLTGSTKTYTVENTNSATNGQVRITEISVTYISPEMPASFTVTWDLSKKTYDNDASTTKVTWSNPFVNMVLTKGNSGTDANNYLGGDGNNRTSSRFYSNQVLTLTPNNCSIKSIEFTATSENYAKALKNSTWTNATATVSGSTVTVTANGRGAVSAVIGGTCGITSVKVYLSNYNLVAKISRSGYTTFTSANDLSFEGVDGLEAVYIVESSSATSARLKEITAAPAGTGVILKGTENAEVVFSKQSYTGGELSNILVGVLEDTPVTQNTVYVVSGGKFMLFAGESIPAGKAYLPASAISGTAPSLSFDFDDDATGIQKIERTINDNQYYTLDGRRVTEPTKGLYIVNGRKVVIK